MNDQHEGPPSEAMDELLAAIGEMQHDEVCGVYLGAPLALGAKYPADHPGCDCGLARVARAADALAASAKP